AGLAQLLGDDVGRGVGVEEAVADDLADDFLGAHRGALGPAFLAPQRRRPPLVEALEELVIARPAEAVLGGGGGAAEAFALSLDEHEESFRGLIVRGDKQRAPSTDDSPLGQLETHERSPPMPCWSRGGLRRADR